jgi:hypothetical protein
MSDEELKFPKWQTSLRDLILEFDPERFNEKAQIAEALIFERLAQVSPEAESQEEQHALHDGLSLLQSFKRDRTGVNTCK